MSHRLRSMMPWPARHQSRTISPELLDSGPRTRTRAVLPSLRMAQRPERGLALAAVAVLARHQAVVRRPVRRRRPACRAARDRRGAAASTRWLRAIRRVTQSPRVSALHRPQPDRAVEAFGAEVGQLLGQLQLDLQRGVLFAERPPAPGRASAGRSRRSRPGGSCRPVRSAARRARSRARRSLPAGPWRAGTRPRLRRWR